MNARVVSLYGSTACLESGDVVDIASNTILFSDPGIRHVSNGFYQSHKSIYTPSFIKLNFTADSFVIFENKVLSITEDAISVSQITKNTQTWLRLRSKSSRAIRRILQLNDATIVSADCLQTNKSSLIKYNEFFDAE